MNCKEENAMEESKNFRKVKQYYDMGLWNLAKVMAAVGKWITQDEYAEITGSPYSGIA